MQTKEKIEEWHCFYIFAAFFILLSRRQVTYFEGGSIVRILWPYKREGYMKRDVVFGGDVAFTTIILPSPARAHLVKLREVWI